jgi:hypothetical protein
LISGSLPMMSEMRLMCGKAGVERLVGLELEADGLPVVSIEDDVVEERRWFLAEVPIEQVLGIVSLVTQVPHRASQGTDPARLHDLAMAQDVRV